MQIKLILKGGLHWYVPERQEVLSVEVNQGEIYRDVIERFGIPISEIAFIQVDGEIKELNQPITEDVKSVVVMAVVGGG